MTDMAEGLLSVAIKHQLSSRRLDSIRFLTMPNVYEPQHSPDLLLLRSLLSFSETIDNAQRPSGIRQYPIALFTSPSLPATYPAMYQ
jgi:hypothetical protein